MEIINEKNFKEKTQKGVVLVDFFATWCGPCRMLGPVLEEVQEEFSDKVKMFKVDVDEDEKLARSFGILSIPTVLIFVNGELKDKHVGFMSKDEVSEMLMRVL